MPPDASSASGLYARLPKGSMRLLELEGTCLTGKEGDKLRDLAIRCSLRTVAADELLDNPYAALSYTWGPRQAVRYLVCNGRSVAVTSNLYDALWQMMFGSTPVSWSLWIDAVCINQNDDGDKSQQVAQMHKIYTNATHVLIWLGRLATTHNDKALVGFWKFLESSSSGDLDFEDLEMYKESQEYKEGQQFFSTCAWFHRAWTFQEIVLAQRALVLCDAFVTSWEKIAEILPDSLEINGIEEQRENIDEGEAYEYESELVQLLGSMVSRQATDPRDKIYAILGIYSGNFAFIPDYGQDLTWACTQAASVVGRETNGLHYLDVLAHSSFPALRLCDPHSTDVMHRSNWVSTFAYRTSRKAPIHAYRPACLSPRSWVPDWTTLDRDTLLLMGEEEEWDFPEEEDQFSPEYDYDNARLTVKGAIVALFTTLEPTFDNSGHAVAFLQRTPSCISTQRDISSEASPTPPSPPISFDSKTAKEIGGERVYQMLQAHRDETCGCEFTSSNVSLNNYQAGDTPNKEAPRSFYSGFVCKIYGSVTKWLLLPHYDQKHNRVVYSILGSWYAEKANLDNLWERLSATGIEDAFDPIMTTFDLTGRLDSEPWPDRDDIGDLCCSKSTALAVELCFQQEEVRGAGSGKTES